MARYGKQRRARKKHREREHLQWMQEQAEDALDQKGGEFIVLTWPGPTRSKPMNYKAAEELWRNTEKAMIFRDSDFYCKESNNG